MLDREYLSLLSHLPQPVLTVYLDTNPSEQDNQRSAPGYVAWLKTEAKSLLTDVPSAESRAFREQLVKVENFLANRTVKHRGLVIFSGAVTWRILPLEIQLTNELRWGAPAIGQLTDLLDGRKPSCVVAVDRAGARFFRYDLGALTEFAEHRFEVDTSDWKRKSDEHGAQQDAFQHKMDAQYLRLCREVAEHVKKLCAAEHLFSIFLVGSKRLIEPIASEFPREFDERVSLVAEDLARVPVEELHLHLEPKILEWSNTFSSSRIRRLLSGDQTTVVGIDETLAQIQNGTLSTVMLARGLEAKLHKCMHCGLMSRSSDLVCPSCGGKRSDIMLSEALAELSRANGTEVEIVEGEAAQPLMQSGGIGGWLRRPRQAYEVPSTRG